MNSSLIGKFEKARRYPEERNRVSFTTFDVQFRGENDVHLVSFRDGKLACNCDFYHGWSTCSHTMAMEQLLEGMIAQAALSGQHT